MCTMFLVGGHIYTEWDCSQWFFLLHTELTCISRMQFLSTVKRWDTHSVLLLFKIACWSNTNSATDFPHYSAPLPSWLLQIVGCCEIRFPIVTCPWGAKMIFLQWHIHQQPTQNHYYQTRVDFGHLELYGCIWAGGKGSDYLENKRMKPTILGLWRWDHHQGTAAVDQKGVRVLFQGSKELEGTTVHVCTSRETKRHSGGTTVLPFANHTLCQTS